ncbi:MAG: hypothetical protein K2X09_03160 [Rickettsiales bacterium]|nr:hypothetical protein [Rickettsiales bacterium]
MSKHRDDYDDDYDDDEREDPRAGRKPARRERDDEAGAGISKKEINNFASDAFKQSAKAMGDADIGKTKKLFGLFEVDAGIIAWFGSIYNVGADYASQFVAPRAFNLVKKYGPKAGLAGEQLQSAAALASIGSTVVIKTAGYFGPIWESYASQRTERGQLARSLGGVLDTIKGNHSVGALYSVKQSENEVIFAHRKRLATIAHTTNLGNWIDLGLNAGANLALDVKRFHSIWTEKANVTEEEMKARALKRQKELEVEAETGAIGDSSQGKHLVGLLVNSSVPQLAERVKRSGEHKLKHTLQPYSALEMILELNKQVSSKADARSFEVPRGFQSKGGRESYPLEEYLMRICIQHQKDMADIDPEHTEIREALRDDLASAVKPIADAIRKGDLSTMALVSLVGEGKIIKKHGRAIADAEQVQAAIKHEAPKQAVLAPVDPVEYYKDVAFSRGQLKTALKSLEGDEKLSFATMFPDAVLAEAGMKKDEIKAMRDATMKHYDTMLSEAMLGLNAKSDEQLKAEGLVKKEIEHVRNAAKLINSQGEEAIRDLKTSPVNENGVERLLANVVVHQPSHMGTLLSTGKHALANRAENDNLPAENDNEGHAERETSRRNGTDGAEAYRE